ncbi:MAG: GNAT family N-acetyltransferase [Clostridiales bacterium]|nr:GNAT family N-acetyltransferase [Clostridiales bacterium]
MARFEIVNPLSGSCLTIKTKRLYLSVYKPCMAPEVTSYLVRNRSFHKPFTQVHKDRYFTISEQKAYLKSDLGQYKNNTQVGFWLSRIEEPGKIIGRLSFYSIIGGAMMTSFVGYHIDEACQGQGYMTEALQAGCDFMFKYYRLHRIQADVMPHNEKSQAVVEKCGFVKMGYNIRYMEIDGKYQDHVMYVLLNPEVEP